MAKMWLLDDGNDWDTDDDEFDATTISDWLAMRDFEPEPILPMSAADPRDWAHENEAAWPMVDLPTNMTVAQALSIMVEAQERHGTDPELLARDAEPGTEERKNPYHQKNGKFGFRPTPNLAAPHPTSGNPSEVARHRVARAKAKEPGLTSYTGKLAKKHGGRQEGLPFRLKTHKSLARKIGNDVRDGKGKVTSEEVADKMFDVNRYTTVFDEANYAKGSQATLDQMRADGHSLRVKNFWANEDNPYQGINVQVTGSDGTKWELQFHTDTSFEVKEGEAHVLYEKQRVELNEAKKAEYDAQLAAVFAKIPVPADVLGVS